MNLTVSIILFQVLYRYCSYIVIMNYFGHDVVKNWYCDSSIYYLFDESFIKHYYSYVLLCYKAFINCSYTSYGYFIEGVTVVDKCKNKHTLMSLYLLTTALYSVVTIS